MIDDNTLTYALFVLLGIGIGMFLSEVISTIVEHKRRKRSTTTLLGVVLPPEDKK